VTNWGEMGWGEMGWGGVGANPCPTPHIGVFVMYVLVMSSSWGERCPALQIGHEMQKSNSATAPQQ